MIANGRQKVNGFAAIIVWDFGIGATCTAFFGQEPILGNHFRFRSIGYKPDACVWMGMCVFLIGF